MTKLFVSYGRGDVQRVQAVVQELSTLGLDFWMDTRNLQVGDIWTKEITKGIDACDAFLLFLSNNSMSSDNVRREVQLAYEKKKKILILKLDDSPILGDFEFLIAGIQWVMLDTINWQSRLVLALGNEKIHHIAANQDNETASQPPTRTSPFKRINDKKELKQDIPAENSSAGLIKILLIIEHMCYNGDLFPEQGKILEDIYKDVAMKKKELGEKTMSSISQEHSDDTFLRSSRTIAFYLLSLTDHHNEWPNLNLSNQIKDESLILLRRVQDEVLTSSVLIEQLSNSEDLQNFTFETERIIDSLRSLRLQFANIDKYLFSGNLPYEVSNEIERHFDNLVYYLNKYILILDNLAGTGAKTNLVQ